jgi:type VI protein secretion system component Hcp
VSLNIFLKLDGVVGEFPATPTKAFAPYKGAIAVHSFKWGVTAETTWSKGGGASVGKPSVSSLDLTIPSNSVAPQLLRFILTGTSIASGTLDILQTSPIKAGIKAPATVKLHAYKLTEMFVGSYQFAPAETDVGLHDSVSLVFKTVDLVSANALGKTTHISFDVPGGKVG